VSIAIDLSDRTAIVTGAGAGIGREIARWLARAGASVAVADIRADKAEETVALILDEVVEVGARSEAFAVVADARDDTELERMVEEAAYRLDGLDIAVNNIGMLGPRGSAPLLDLDGPAWRDVLDQNLVITALSMRAEAKAMLEYGPGGEDGQQVIINITSGETTRPAPGLAGYGAAKAAINHVTDTAAVEWGPLGIRVVAIAPGTTLTETVADALPEGYIDAVVASTPLRRMTEHDELGRLVVFLASDLARSITGGLILADAGASLSRTRPRIPGGPD
jgi:NAD(P)-dependent dehydrogenase (short-subunit alcohol dehydrogenase family)